MGKQGVGKFRSPGGGQVLGWIVPKHTPWRQVLKMAIFLREIWLGWLAPGPETDPPGGVCLLLVGTPQHKAPIPRGDKKKPICQNHLVVTPL